MKFLFSDNNKFSNCRLLDEKYGKTYKTTEGVRNMFSEGFPYDIPQHIQFGKSSVTIDIRNVTMNENGKESDYITLHFICNNREEIEDLITKTLTQFIDKFSTLIEDNTEQSLYCSASSYNIYQYLNNGGHKEWVSYFTFNLSSPVTLYGRNTRRIHRQYKTEISVQEFNDTVNIC